MTISIILIVFLTFVGVLYFKSTRKKQPKMLVGVKFDPLTKAFGMPIITVPINGIPYRFIVDTGSDTSVILPEIAEEIALERCKDGKTITIGGVSGEQEVVPEIIKFKIQLKTRSYLLSAYVHNIQTLEKLNKKYKTRVAGLLGSDTLQETKAVISFKKKCIVFTKQE